MNIGNYTQHVDFEIDTGASVSVIPFNNGLPKLKPYHNKIKGPNMMDIEIRVY